MLYLKNMHSLKLVRWDKNILKFYKDGIEIEVFLH